MVLGGWESVRLNGWSWEVGSQSNWTDGPGRLGVSQTERMVLGGWESVRLNGRSWEVGGQSDWTDGPGRLGVSQTERMVLGDWGQSDWMDGPGKLGVSWTERMALGGWGSVGLNRWCWEVRGQSDWTDGPGRLGVSQPKPFVYTAPAEMRLLLARRERWIFKNRGVILTLIVHWLGPPLFLPWCSEATLAIWSEGLAQGPYQKTPAGSEARTCHPQNARQGLLPIELSWPLLTTASFRRYR